MDLLKVLTDQGMIIKSVQRKNEGKWYHDDISVILDLDFGHRSEHTDLIQKLRNMDRVRFVEEV